MNLANKAGDADQKLLFAGFNQDCTSLAVGTKTGFQLYSLNSISDNLELIYQDDHDKEVCIVERLFSSSLIAVVSLIAPRKLKVLHFKKGTEILRYSYSSAIRSLKINRMRLVVCLEESIHIHSTRDMNIIHTIKDVVHNPTGLCAVSQGNEPSYIAYPASLQNGTVQLFDVIGLRALTHISAHENPVVALAFNLSSEYLATASDKGTVIRVLSVPDGMKVYEFRRGLKRCVEISSLRFSEDTLFLAASSNTETVHVFKLEKVESEPESSQSWSGYMSQALRSSASFLPSQVTDVLSLGRAFCTAHLPYSGLRTVCALKKIDKLPRLLVVNEEGELLVYNVDPKESGAECALAKKHRLVEGIAVAGSDSSTASGLSAPASSTAAEDSGAAIASLTTATHSSLDLDLANVLSDTNGNPLLPTAALATSVSPRQRSQNEELMAVNSSVWEAGDATYAYKLKQPVPIRSPSSSDMLCEIVDNVPIDSPYGNESPAAGPFKLDDERDFPSVASGGE